MTNPPTDEIERVARAMCAALSAEKPKICHWNALHREERELYETAAAAAITAMDTRLREQVAALRGHISEQITHVETRIQDGMEMGATVWRLALEDVARENRAALTDKPVKP